MPFTIQHNLSLKSLNTFGIAATARVACTLTDDAGVDEALEALQQEAPDQNDSPAARARSPAASITAATSAASTTSAALAATAAATATNTHTGTTPASAPPQRPFILGGGSNLLLARDLTEPLLLVRTQGRQWGCSPR